MANRIGRLELLFWFVTSIFGAGIALAFVSVLANTPIEPERTRYPCLQAVWLLAAALVMLKAIVSRFHDIGWPGWAVLVMAVPVVGQLRGLAQRTKINLPKPAESECCSVIFQEPQRLFKPKEEAELNLAACLRNSVDQ